jgi:hypothetical protein
VFEEASVIAKFRNVVSKFSCQLTKYDLQGHKPAALYHSITRKRVEDHCDKASIRHSHGWTTGVRLPAGARNLFSTPSVQTGSEAHPASYTICTGGSFPGGNAAAD